MYLEELLHYSRVTLPPHFKSKLCFDNFPQEQRGALHHQLDILIMNIYRTEERKKRISAHVLFVLKSSFFKCYLPSTLLKTIEPDDFGLSFDLLP